MVVTAAAVAGVIVGVARAQQPTGGGSVAPTSADGGSAPSPKGSLREVFPGVRLDAAAKVVEFDAEVIVDHTDPKKVVFLEVLACPRDTKEHESLVMTTMKPSHVHAAMLAAGFVPGKPVEWSEGAKPVATPPSGDKVRVEFVWREGEAEKRASPLEWVVNQKDGTRASSLGHGFVFAGSVLIKQPSGKERYDADSAGTLVGLASFGSETIAWTKPFSPEAAVDAPVWIADRERVPKIGTRVVVRVSPGDGESSKAAEPQNDK